MQNIVPCHREPSWSFHLGLCPVVFEGVTHNLYLKLYLIVYSLVFEPRVIPLSPAPDSRLVQPVKRKGWLKGNKIHAITDKMLLIGADC